MSKRDEQANIADACAVDERWSLALELANVLYVYAELLEPMVVDHGPA